MLEVKPSIRILSGQDIEQSQRQAWEARLAIGYPERHGSRLIHEEIVRDVAMEFQPAQALLRKQSRQDNQAQHHGEQQVEEIVAGIDCCDSNGQRKQQKPDTFCRRSNGSAPGEPPGICLKAVGQ
ncbi:MAG: hypothetical protein K0S45_1630 [Nitrospira sp.]|nr:hypothetical protein [Nitrospira sp.]